MRHIQDSEEVLSNTQTNSELEKVENKSKHIQDSRANLVRQLSVLQKEKFQAQQSSCRSSSPYSRPETADRIRVSKVKPFVKKMNTSIDGFDKMPNNFNIHHSSPAAFPMTMSGSEAASKELHQVYHRGLYNHPEIEYNMADPALRNYYYNHPFPNMPYFQPMMTPHPMMTNYTLRSDPLIQHNDEPLDLSRKSPLNMPPCQPSTFPMSTALTVNRYPFPYTTAFPPHCEPYPNRNVSLSNYMLHPHLYNLLTK